MKIFRYEGAKLAEISFPVGGVGAGCVGLAGNGALVDWEVQNHPDKGVINPQTHFAVKAVSNGKLLDARVLQGDYPGRKSGNYEGNKHQFHGFGYGVAMGTMAGFPHFRSCAFEGTFPTAKVCLSDGKFPGEVSLTAFSAFIPHDADSSGLPRAFYEVCFANPLPETVDYYAAFTLHPLLNHPAVQVENGRNGTMLAFANGTDSLCVATDCPDTHVQKAWYRSNWFEGATLYWRDFVRPGFMPERVYETPGHENATLEARITLKPGETGSIRFALAWYVPICENDWEGPREGENVENLRWRNHYATRFPDAKSIACDGLRHWHMLREKTFSFRNALYASTMPPAALDAAGSCLSVLVTPVCMRLEDGSFYGWEGANEHGGSCEGSCQHVWNYAYALPFLFPELERSVRELEKMYSQFPDGRMAFRLKLPPGRMPGWPMPCVDGQFGYVMKVYHHWKLTGDTAWLRTMWNSVSRAVAFAWTDSDVRWDPGRTGILSGRQHHTLDRELLSPSSWLQGFYLGALDAAREMAEVLGEDSAEYARVYEAGRTYLNTELFNGAYYAQKIDVTDRSLTQVDAAHENAHVAWSLADYWSEEYGEIIYQIGEGCLLDQALAQWHMNLMGLHSAFNKEKLHIALDTIFRNNFKNDMHDEFNPCRVFCLDGEAGTMICTYPEGHPMQAVPIPYCQEMMTGFEYAAAGLMLQEGKRAEGERMIEAVRARYDGSNRNPWNEIECGNNYARSMAAFALTNIYAGFQCDMVSETMRFDPLLTGGVYRGTWFTGSAWGEVELNEDCFELRVLDGELALKTLFPGKLLPVRAELDGRNIPIRLCSGAVCFEKPILLQKKLTLWSR